MEKLLAAWLYAFANCDAGEKATTMKRLLPHFGLRFENSTGFAM
jgi:hypothetical protein